MDQNKHYYALILAGGGGTRLWPKSRKKQPKHLLSLVDKETLLKTTYKRIATIIPPERIFVITLEDHAKFVYEQLTNLPKQNIILEPEQKNTALAMGVGAAFIKKIDPDAVIINLAADQTVEDIKKFGESALLALKVASSGDYIVSIGIKPTFPHTGMGYIKIGDEFENEHTTTEDYVFKGKGFKEKPNLATAQSFVASGQYLWNASLYTWSIPTVFKAFENFAPHICEALNTIYDAIGTSSQQKTIEKVYSEIGNPNSIDYEVSEKAKNILVVPGDFGWSDVGDWKVVYDISAKSPEGNVVIGEDRFIGIDTRDCLIEPNGRLVVAVGLQDIVVVDTEDAILICAKDKTQDVKKAVEKLKELKKEKFL